MRRKIIALFMAISLLVLSACSIKGGWVMANEGEIIDARFEQIVNSLKTQDKNALKSMFSATAISQFADFDNQITDFLGFIKGDIKSWKRTAGPASEEGKNDDGSGRVWKEIRATYTVVTSEQEYYFSLQEITKYSQDINRIGVSSLCVINSNDWENDFVFWGDFGKPDEFETLGICIGLKPNTEH